MAMIEEIKFGFQILQFLITGAIGVYVYMSNKDKVTNDRIGKLQDDIDNKIDNHGERIAGLEARSKEAPTHNDLSKLYEKVNHVSGCLSELQGEFKGACRTLDLIHETLMEERRK